MRRISIHRLAALAAGLLLSATLVAPASAASRPRVVVSGGALRDLAPSTTDVTDGARGKAIAVVRDDKTFVLLVLTRLDREHAGMTHGAHVHVGPCVAGDGAAAGPHYNAGGGVSPSTEVWLDFTVNRGGVGVAHSSVPFAIPPGAAGSIVIHALGTDHHTGAAGGRLACLPMQF